MALTTAKIEVVENGYTVTAFFVSEDGETCDSQTYIAREVGEALWLATVILESPNTPWLGDAGRVDVTTWDKHTGLESKLLAWTGPNKQEARED